MRRATDSMLEHQKSTPDRTILPFHPLPPAARVKGWVQGHLLQLCHQ